MLERSLQKRTDGRNGAGTVVGAAGWKEPFGARSIEGGNPHVVRQALLDKLQDFIGISADRAKSVLLEIEITALVMGGEKIRLIEGVIGERLSQVGKVEEDAGIIRDKEFGFQQELLDILCVCSLDFYAGMDAGKASGKALHFRMKLDEQRIVILLQQFSHLWMPQEGIEKMEVRAGLKGLPAAIPQGSAPGGEDENLPLLCVFPEKMVVAAQAKRLYNALGMPVVV